MDGNKLKVRMTLRISRLEVEGIFGTTGSILTIGKMNRKINKNN